MRWKIVTWALIFLASGLCISAKNYRCTFEKNFCSYLKNDPKNTVKWQLGEGRLNAMYTGPSVDHTFGNSSGKYLFVNVTAAGADPVRLLGPDMSKNYCINFWYHMFGADVGSLTVEAGGDTYFYRSSSQGDRWKQGIFSVEYSALMGSSYRVAFAVWHTSHKNFLGDIALDDIEFKEGKCVRTLDSAKELCTFDHDKCGYTTWRKVNQLSWEITDPKEPRLTKNLVREDHTLGTDKGGYWYAHTNSAKVTEKAVLSSSFYTDYQVKRKQCLHFYYYMDADYDGFWWWDVNTEATLEVHLNFIKKANDSLIWKKGRSETRHKVWSYAEAKVETPMQFMIDFIASIKTSNPAYIAIDDVKIINGQCPETGSCNFEEDKCSWTDGDADFVWLRKNGKSNSNNEKGPSKDKTSDSSEGYYVFINLANVNPNLRARLESDPFLPTKKPTCVIFWYYMKGNSDLGELKVIRHFENSTEITLWYLTGHQFKGWQLGQAPAFPSSLSVKTVSQYIFEGVTGKDRNGFIALDDVAVRSGENCSLTPEHADPRYESQNYKCDFESNWCRFLTNDPQNTVNWQLGEGKISAKHTGPSVDHTYGNSTGKYLFVNSTAARSRSISLWGPAMNRSYCISFWYHMFGADIGRLNVFIQYGKGKGYTEDIYFTRQKSQGDRWKQATFFVKYNKGVMHANYKVGFAAKNELYSKLLGDIALDDIDFKMNACPNASVDSSILCTFDDGPCGFTISNPNAKLKWQLQDGVNLLSSSGPIVDHTLGTAKGGFWYVHSDMNLNEDKAILSSRTYREHTEGRKQCLHFYFYMDANTTGSWYQSVQTAVLEVHLNFDNKTDDTQVWSRMKDNTRHHTWSYGEAKVETPKRFNINFVVSIKTSIDAIIAVDDVMLIDGQCPEAGTCNFDDGDKCSWTDGEADMVWLRKNGDSNTNNEKGPSRDKTTNSPKGYYAFINVANKEPNMKAILESEPFLPTSKPTCIVFWYYMKGDKDLGKLRVIRKLEDITEAVLWELHGHQFDGWKLAEAPATPSILSSQVVSQYVFEGVTGKGRNGFIALDNIAVRTGDNCMIKPNVSDPRYISLNEIQCSFDDLHLCSWGQTNDTLQWQFGNMSALPSTGPKAPVGEKGHYIFISSYDAVNNSGEVARLNSAVITSLYPESGCFSFYYYMFGAHVNELRVVLAFMKNKDEEKGRGVIWRRRGTQPDKWIHFRDTLKMDEGEYRLIIEADGGSEFAGDIAIDEITFELGGCINSGICDFESSLCGWSIQPSKNKKFYWFRTVAFPTTKGPEFDHTTLTEQGYFLQATADRLSSRADETVFVSPKLNGEWEKHCFTFWYYRPGNSTGKITVSVLVNDTESFRWAVSDDVGKLWHYGQTNTNMNEDFQIVIIATKGTNETFEMAIDDIMIKNGECPNPAECSFNNDYCSYFQNSSSDFAWLLGSGRVVNTQLIEDPPMDNTNAMFVYADMTSPYLKEGQNAVLVSEILEHSTTQQSCLEFDFHMSGDDEPTFSVGTMSLKNVEEDMKYIIKQRWMTDRVTGPGWMRVLVNITDVSISNLRTFQLYFKVERGSGPSGLVAFDNIAYSDGVCTVPTTAVPEPITEMPSNDFSCDFDNGGFCNWIPERSDIKWSISVPRKTKGDMPKYDHTKQNYDGMYAYLMGDEIMERTSNLQSPVFPKEWKSACFSFWYILNSQVRIKVQLLCTVPKGLSYATVWERGANLGYGWRHAYVNLKAPSGQKLDTMLNVTGIISSKGVIAVDDFAVGGDICPLSKTCDFEVSLKSCDYSQDSQNTAFWSVKAGTDKSIFFTIPDHTTRTTSGKFLYISFRKTLEPLRSRILTKPRQPSEIPTCVMFYYHIYNTSKLTLNTYIVTDNGLSDPLWSVSISQGLLWHGARFNAVSKTLEWEVVFEAEVQKNGDGQIALDDISFDMGACSDPGYCDFEKEDCLWENVQSPEEGTVPEKGVSDLFVDDLDWVRHIGEDNFGPPTDNTLKSPEGFYLFLNTLGTKAGEKAVYISERLQTSASVCFTFSYFIRNVPNTGTFKVFSSSDFNQTKEVKAFTKHTGDSWVKASVTVTPEAIMDKPYKDFWIILVGYANLNQLGYIALDDLTVSDGLCSDQIEYFDCKNGDHVNATDVCNFRKDCENGFDEVDCAECDFESGVCGWISQSAQYSPFRWTRVKAGQGGLTSDHTNGDASGHFMVVALRQPTFSKRISRLKSPVLRDAFSPCIMEFWYNVRDIVEFQIHLKRNNIFTEVWVLGSKNSYVWTRTDIVLSRITTTFELILTAKSNTDISHVAVDDIVMIDCETPPKLQETYCRPDKFNCKNSRCISKEKVCDYTDDCGNFMDERIEPCATIKYRCSFEQSLCDWDIEKSQVTTWSRRSPFEKITQGPTRDHTTGTKSGMFLFLAGKVSPSPSRLLGPLFQPDEKCKIRFHYDIRGIGELSLQIKTRTEIRGEENVVWSRETETEGFFFIEEIVAFSETNSFQVIIEGSIKTGEGIANYIAIDDISFSEECTPQKTGLPTASPSITTSPPEFTCESYQSSCQTGGRCINKTQVCDFLKDCDDGSDEKFCGQCDFEKDMCGLKDTTNLGNYKWKRYRADDASLTKNMSLPDKDSSGHSDGYFVLLSAKDRSSGGLLRAIMETPKLGEMAHSCKLEFFYNYNVQSGKFEVSVLTPQISKTRKVLFSPQAVTGRRWQHVSIGVGNYPAGKVFEFRGISNYWRYASTKPQGIAIDHINYVYCNPHFIRNFSLNCTFDEDVCGWFPDNENTNVNWKLGKKPANLYAPKKDHTGNAGYFMFLETNGWRPRDSKARLVSLRQSPTNESCMTFYYHMYGQYVGTLNILVKTNTGNNTVWSRSNSQGNGWKFAESAIKSSENYTIVIEGIPGSSRKTVIAIDDIFILKEACPIPVECDFESGYCEWTSEGWILQRGDEGTPAVDHSTGSSKGHYAFLGEEPGNLISPAYNHSQNGHCLNFWYFMEGRRNDSLSVFKVPESIGNIDTLSPIWNDVAQPNKAGRWMHASTNIDDKDLGLFSLYFHGVRVNESTSFVAIDDFKLGDGTCPPYGSCNFEADMCTWANLVQPPYNSGLRWLRNSGSTFTEGTGPMFDHTTGTENGWYIFVDTDSSSSLRKTATLESENLHYGPEACIKFWYHMYGKNVGTLEVAYYSPDDNKIFSVNHIYGNQGNQWKEYGELIPLVPKTYRVRLIGTAKGDKGGDIAIDDILIQSETCDIPVTSTPEPTLSPLAEYSCDFESGTLCNWEGERTWVVQDGRRAALNHAGPHQDHNGRSETRYAYYHPLGDTMEDLRSPEIGVELNDHCLGFWYYLHSTSPISLQLLIIQSESLHGPLWMKKDSGDTSWKHGSFHFEKGVNLTILLRATRPVLGIGDIAVDDIEVNVGRCSLVKGEPCDFESADICGYKTDSSDKVAWRRVLGREVTGGPKKDKTFNTNKGHYMLVIPSPTARNYGDNQALLITPNIPSTGEDSSCLRFWYQIAGQDVSSLNVHFRTPGGNLSPYALWSHSAKAWNRWTIGQQEINAKFPHEIVFQAITHRGDNGYIALDDVILEEGACQPPGSCNFEKDMCTWVNSDSGVTAEWVRNRGPTANNMTGPEIDHTLGTTRGSYAYLQSENPAGQQNLIAILKSEFFSGSSPRCLSFWAHMYGEKMGTLSVNVSYYDENNVKMLVDAPWKIENNQGVKWFNRLFSINTTNAHEEYQILFIGMTKGNLGDIALDDIEVTNGFCYQISDIDFDCKDGNFVNKSQVCDFEVDCPHGEDEVNCGNCDFEHGDCEWSDISSFSFYSYWKRKQGMEEKKRIGPGYDHTSNSSVGYFMMSEISRYQRQAVLQSPEGINQFKKSYASCIMKFYYSMPKKATNSFLRIRKRLESSSIGSIWERVGGEVDGWKLGIAYIGTTEWPFYIEFVHKHDGYGYEYTAIDDIRFEDCGMRPKRNSCSSGSEFTCANERCVPLEYRCDLTDDCGDGSDESRSTCLGYPEPCTFDDNDCGWTAEGKRNNWVRKSSSSSHKSSNSGPLVDHTIGLDANGGKYLYLTKALATKIYNSSYYYSPNYQNRLYSSCDIRFYYYMHGTENASLKIHAEFETGGWSWKELWSRDGSFGQSWNRGSASLLGRKAFHFIIEGIINDETSALAIDDISLSYGCDPYDGNLSIPASTEMPTASPICPKGQFMCHSGKTKCIDNAKKCDFYDDCDDGSDEINCGNCDFSVDTCGWKDESSGRFKWDRKNGSYPNTNGPTVDYENTTDGYFMYVKKSSGFYAYIATLVSPALPPSSSHCFMSFWYYLDGSDSMNIAVKHKYSLGFNSVLLTLNGPQGNSWNFTEVKVPIASNGGGKILIESRITKERFNTVGDAAIDDIKFINCNPKRLLVDCDFDDDSFHDGFCFWTQRRRESMYWIRSKGVTSRNATGPSSDHTTGNGYYLYVDPKYQREKQVARLTSPIVPIGESDSNCFSFWYHMYGSGIGHLEVFTKKRSIYSSTSKWKKDKNQGRRWNHAEFSISGKSDISFIIEATARNSRSKQGNIAIDDIKLIEGRCPKTMTCDFESNLCGWSTSFKGKANWIRSQGSGNFSYEKPQRDHTTGTENGYFLYLPRLRQLDIARLESPEYKNVGEVCVKFWYFMFGDDIGSLSVYQRTHQETRLDNNKQLWVREGQQVLAWKQGKVSLESLPTYYIRIEGKIGTKKDEGGFIALDDIHVTHGACSDPVSCNFEIDTCGWTVSEAFMDFDWIRRTGLDQNMGKGPEIDVTTNTVQGHYMYAYLSGQPAQAKSMLISEDMEIFPEYCFSVWYNIFNVENVSLRLQQMLLGVGWIDVLEFPGNDYNLWKQVELNITVEDAGDFFTIGLLAVAQNDLENSIDNGIAIDDIILKQDFCGIESTTIEPPPPPITTPFPNTKFDCDFESADFCNNFWRNDEDLPNKWIIVTGHHNKSTKPKTDHTTGSTKGHYVLLNSTYSYLRSQKARLISADGLKASTEGTCFKFWYHIYGNNPGKLHLNIRDFNDEDISETLWTKKGSTGLSWIYQQVHILKTYNHRIVVEGEGGAEGDIALDDFSSNVGNCPPREFCDVEYDFCGFSNDPDAQVQWLRGAGINTTGPDVDHTYGTQYGNYFYIDVKTPIKKDDVAILESGSFQPQKKCMRFWYYLYGSNVGTLEVYSRQGDTEIQRWTEVSDNYTFWKGAEVVLNDLTRLPFTYSFRMSAGESIAAGSVAIDDIAIKDDCPDPGSCNFEEDMCLWTNNPNNNMQWLRGSGEMTDVAPKEDVTFKTQFGMFLYVNVMGDKSYKRAPAELFSPFFSPVETRCINFWNFRNGTDKPVLSLIMHDLVEDDTDELIVLSGEKAGKWVNNQAQINFKGQYRLIFQAKLTDQKKQFIALDNIVVTEKNCSDIVEEIPTFSCDKGETVISDDYRCDFFPDCKDKLDETNCGLECDFEVESATPCNWKDSGKGYNIAWKQIKATEHTVPDHDNTNMTIGGGHFMSLISTINWSAFRMSEFTSPLLIQSASTCRLFFWYYTKSVSFESQYLEVFYDSPVQVKKVNVFKLDMGKGSRAWRQAEAVIGRITHRFRVIISGSVRSAATVIAIDDLKFEDCAIPRPSNESTECSENEYKCRNKICIPDKLLCDFNDDCGDYSDENPVLAKCNGFPARCDFEEDLCDWTPSESDYKWSRVATSSRYSYRITRDHTKNSINGYYLYSPDHHIKGYLARIQSPVMKAVSPKCALRFFYTYARNFDTTDYQKYNNIISSFTVYVRQDMEGSWDPVLNVNVPFGQYYEKAIIPFYDITGPFEVIIESMTGDTKNGEWAIDDVSFTQDCMISNESLPFIRDELITTDPSVIPCDDENAFRCMDGSGCLKMTQVCDFIPQCSDGSDENKCGSCNFDDDNNPTCGWVNSKLNRWVRQQGSQGKPGPGTDVSGNGYYMYVSSAKDGFISSEAILQSAELHEASSKCEISFSYYMTGLENSHAALKLWLQMNNGTTVSLWSEKEDKGKYWIKAVVGYGHKVNNWKLQFVATHIPKTVNDGLNVTQLEIAVDDINFLNCVPVENRECQNELDFPCGAGRCIDASLVCDFNPDCADGSDETNCENYKERCDFENGDLCTWTQNAYTSFKWQVKSGQEIEDGRGPQRDHTIGDETGRFLFLPAKTSWFHESCILYSTPFKGDTSGDCVLRLWYHMLAEGNSKLNIGIVDAGDKRLASILIVNGSVADEWVRVAVPLKRKTKFQAVIDGRPQNTIKAEIAIDDISFSETCFPMSLMVTTPIPTVQPGGKCALNGTFECEDNSCIPLSEVCDFKTDCPYGADERQCPSFCTFEDGSTCDWYAKTTSGDGVQFNVVAAESAHADYPYVPFKDVTTGKGTGRYLLVHQDVAREVGPIDIYASPDFTAAASTCRFQFWYSARNRESQKTLVILNYLNNKTIEMVELSETYGNWAKFEMGLGRRSSNFSVSFSKPGKNEKGSYFALDDIKFDQCALPPPRQLTCKGMFQCKVNKACVNLNKICDLTDDCGDSTDEQNCDSQKYLSTDFELGYGFFRPVTRPGRAPLSWQRLSGSAIGHVAKYIGPPFDHTSSDSGFYAMFTSGGVNNNGKKAWLASEVVEAKGDCQIRFHYYMYGPHINMLSVSTRTKAGENVVEKWKKEGEVGNFWVLQELTLNESKPFEVLFEGYAGVDSKDVIALDDISFTPDCKYVQGATLPPETTGTTTSSSISPGTCASEKFYCEKDLLCISREKVCDFRRDCSDGQDEAKCVKPECHFQDGGLCGWGVENRLKQTRRKRDTGDYKFTWIAIQADDRSAKINKNYRPKRDHTHDSTIGWYLLADGFRGIEGDVTSLVSPVISITHAKCALDFWLYCGKWFCELKCIAEELKDGKSASNNTLWKAHDQGFELLSTPNEWKHAKVHLSHLKNYKIRLDTIRPFNYEGTLCLDDISFDNCPPPVKIEDSSAIKCAKTEFSCKNNRCINAGYKCDYCNDCLDNSDEAQDICEYYGGKCTFERDTCPDWHMQADYDERTIAKWTVEKTQNDFGTRPASDHTTQAPGGKYLSVSMTTLKPLFYSDTLASGKQNCKLRLWFNLIGIGHSLNIHRRYRYDRGHPLLKTLNDTVQHYWHNIQIDLGDNGEDFQVVFIPNFSLNVGTVNIDDISLTPECKFTGKDLPGVLPTEAPFNNCVGQKFPCNNGKCYTRFQRCNFVDDCGDSTDEKDCGTSCDFEKDLCGWYNPPGYENIWQRKAGVHSFKSLLTKDHKGNTKGYYMTPMKIKGVFKEGDVSHMQTQPYVASGPDCKINMWYFLSGKNAGNLSVILNLSTGTAVELWKKMGDQGNAWQEETIDIKEQEHFGIAVRAVYGNDWQCYMAVDDIKFDKCAPVNPAIECAADEFMCVKYPECIEGWRRCDGIPDCKDHTDENCEQQYGDCPFDSEDWLRECKWSFQEYNFEWSLAAKSHSSKTGPSKSHSGKGFYLFINSSKQSEQQKAGVSGPLFRATKSKCYVNFWYFMKGSAGMGKLEVLSEGVDEKVNAHWMKSGPQGDEWLHGHAAVESAEDYRVLFVAYVGSDKFTDIAIDDVTFSSNCKEGGDLVVPTGPPNICFEADFHCSSGIVKCIPQFLRCNCRKDCEDGSDEEWEICFHVCPTTTIEPDATTTTFEYISTTGTPIPREHCDPGWKLCSDGSKCIPGLYLCDGVEDCPDSSDERYGCPRIPLCGGETYFCMDGRTPPCIDRSQMCDGTADCTDGSDESLCNQCIPDFCQHGGNCSFAAGKVPICKCEEKYAQNRCSREIYKPDVEKPELLYNATSAAWIPGVVIGIILLIAIGFTIWYKKNTNFERQQMPHAVENPNYGLNLDNLDFNAINEHHSRDFEDSPIGIENPLYAMKSSK